MISVMQFVNASLTELAEATELHKTRWSRYDNGTYIDEETLERVGALIGIEPPDLLLAIRMRRSRKMLPKIKT